MCIFIGRVRKRAQNFYASVGVSWDTTGFILFGLFVSIFSLHNLCVLVYLLR